MLASFGLTPQQALAGKKAIELIQAHTEWPDARLLDIGVRVFGPGFPETPEAIGAAKSDGVFTELRRSEARYFPYQLMKTLQSSGFWGLVRVVPDYHDGDYGARDAAAGVVMEMAIEVGGFVIEDGTSKLGKAREHGRALRELGESIDRGVTPVLVKFEGEISRLTGSMEAQYSDWREILRQILTTETGLFLKPVLSIAPGAITSRRMASTLKQEPKKQ